MKLAWQQKRPLALSVLMVAALTMAGCTSQIADLPIGSPTDASSRSKESPGFLPVNDLPTDRSDAMDVKTREKIQSELVKARDRQAVVTPAKDAAAVAK